MRKPANLEAFDRAINHVGGQTAYARRYDRPQQTVNSRVRAGRPIWAEDVLKVEADTGVSRHDLRPDLYPRDTPPPPPGLADLEAAR